jgi:hypothetical protein
MKAENVTTGSSRIIRISGIPGDMPELLITVGYCREQDGGTVNKAVVLDSLVIPEIIRAINDADGGLFVAVG